MKKYEQTHQKIIQAAEYLLTNNVMTTVSVEKITSYVGINRSTFYRHFPTYQNLIVEIVERKLQAINAVPNNPMDELEHIVSVIEDNYKLFQHIIMHVDNFKYLFQNLLVERIRYIGLAKFKNINLNNSAETELLYCAVVAMFSTWLENSNSITKQDVITFAQKYYLA
ncbi:TetR/AcrR family transcriptional regulator [Periweissella fabalis]|uniref:TetR/AcrR family transcriptional regulator n=1 Tax=Periweissella fabalis TaxID=1070421 RepID=A0A7X6N2I9_9LACO|nr:TetR/AcrR family transcriptional regulator [Periweissella fabalis]MCM0599620.1 TetR/AcrR family transcriptional regulator [Periweissella fabalis]NKZ23925.1 TetR/AcrR family transcriptional regulator [Periweissella fabalis]